MNKNVILQIQNDTTNEKYKFKIVLQIQNIHTYTSNSWILQGGKHPQDALSLQVIFRKRAL